MTTRPLIGLYAALALAACGGGSGTPTPPPPPPPSNMPPSVTVTLSATTFEENGTGTAASASASDPDGDTVALSLSGDDAALFTLDASTGDIAFAAPPDFEAPTDANGDNVYEASIVADDGSGGTDTAAFQITVSDVEALPTFTEVGRGFSFVTYADALPVTDGRILVLEKSGRARLFDPENGSINGDDFLDLSERIGTAGEGGLLGFAIPPDFVTSQQIYFYVTDTDGAIEVRRYDLFAAQLADVTTQTVIISIPHPRDNHKGGWLGFDADGLLLVPTGDSGGAGDPDEVAQDPQSLLGKVLRIDVTGDDFPADDMRNYSIPPGNTYDDPADGRPEIFALGLRNPFRASFDPATGDLLIADVGQNEREEINRLPMDDSSLNFGWNLREGTLPFRGDAVGLTNPVAEYEHGNGPTQGNSITGGVVVDGESEVLDNAYVFADYSSDNIWAIPADATNTANPLFGDEFRYVNDELLIGSERPSGITSIRKDAAGRLIVATLDGEIYRLEERE